MATKTDIVSSTIPALTQSRQGDMACPAGYAAKHIDRRRPASTPEQARGIEIHAAIADYIGHLVSTRQQTDYDYLRAIIAGASPEAAEVLEPFLAAYQFDPDAVLGVEMRLAVDRDWQPVDGDSPEAEFSGGLDVLSLTSPTDAEITDWKSYYRIIDADTFQSRMYSLLVLLHNERLQRVNFTLRFPRFGDAACSLPQPYTRADIPQLRRAVQRERNRQIKLHEKADAGESLPASPGRHCYGCPLNGPQCPIAHVNPHVQMSPPDRVSFAVWLDQAKAANDKALRESVTVNGPAHFTDENGNRWEAAFRGSAQRSYPLVAAFPVIDAWCRQQDDGRMATALTIGGLSTPLKAKKRAALAEQLAAVVETKQQSRFGVRRANEAGEE